MSDWLMPYTPEWLHPYLSLVLIWAALTIPAAVIGWWGVFRKAGLPGWAAFVPGFNFYLLVVGVARLSLLWVVLLCVPLIQIIAAILVNIEVAKRFGRSEPFGLGLSLLGFVFYPLLGFNSDRYHEGVSSTPRENAERKRK